MTKITLAVAALMIAARGITADVPPLPYAAAAAAPASSGSSPSFGSVYSSVDEDSHAAGGPYVQHYNHGSEGFNIQSGYEGYLVPTSSGGPAILLPVRDALNSVGLGSGIGKVAKHFISKGLKIIPKIAFAVIGLVALFAVGCAVTATVCTLTPLCSISFHEWGTARESVRALLTEDRVTAAAAFVTDAIRKYRELYENNKSAGEKQT